MGIGTLMPHLLGVPVWDGGASAPKGMSTWWGQRESAPSGADAQKGQLDQWCPSSKYFKSYGRNDVQFATEQFSFIVKMKLFIFNSRWITVFESVNIETIV
jgi:hypothetical protein